MAIPTAKELRDKIKKKSPEYRRIYKKVESKYREKRGWKGDRLNWLSIHIFMDSTEVVLEVLKEQRSKN